MAAFVGEERGGILELASREVWGGGETHCHRRRRQGGSARLNVRAKRANGRRWGPERRHGEITHLLRFGAKEGAAARDDRSHMEIWNGGKAV